MSDNDVKQGTSVSAGQRQVFGRLGLVVLALVTVVGISVANALLKNARLDLTEGRIYTLSRGTHGMLGKIREPVNIYFFFSDKATAELPYLRTHATRVREMLEEFAENSRGKLKLTVVDPIPFSEDEDRATEFGLKPVNIPGTADPVFLGVAGSSSTGDRQVISFLDPGKEQFLEYELAKLVYTVANPSKPKLALLAGLPMTASFDPATQQVQPAWVVAEQLRQLFQLQLLDSAATAVPEGTRVLMVVHPKNLSPATLYAIDQYVMAGGHAIFFVDPFAGMDPGSQPDNPVAAAADRKASDLDALLLPWGVQVDTDNFIGDDRYALQVDLDGNRPVRHLGILGVDAAGMDQKDVITGGMNVVNIAFAGSISATEKPVASIAPLLQSTDAAGPIAAEKMLVSQNPDLLREDFKALGTRYTLAARLGGMVPSAFPAGPPAGAVAPAIGHQGKSGGPINVVLVADTDLLADRMWVDSRPDPVFGQSVIRPFANNGDFLVNAIDNLMGSGDLIGMRSRATFSRPFERVQAMRRTAEASFRETEQRLQQELQETENQGTVLLSPEQTLAVQQFEGRRLEIRKQLRQVQRGLDQDIENLGGWLKAINIGAVPVLVSLVSYGLVLWRRRRRQAALVAVA
jgi:ABC-type uncharacterized transport system involved in gliding motility auxiliary subunit